MEKYFYFFIFVLSLLINYSYAEDFNKKECVKYFEYLLTNDQLLKPIQEIIKTNTLLGYADTYEAILDQNTKVILEVEFFNTNKHKITTNITTNINNYIHTNITIDGKKFREFWGTLPFEFGLPSMLLPMFEFKRAILIKNNYVIKLPFKDMYNPWFKFPCKDPFQYFYYKNHRIFVFFFSDVAAGYEVLLRELTNDVELVDIWQS